MSVNLVRFYLDADDENRTGCFDGKACEDVDADKAEEYEAMLSASGIPYIRVDL